MGLKQILFDPGGAKNAAGDFGILVLRAAAGLSLAFEHGITKLPPTERFIGGVEKLGFPAANAFAWASALAEFAGGILIAMGLLTRPAAFLVLFNMCVALFLRHSADPFDVKEKALLYGVAALTILFTGSGRFGFDGLIGKK